jgi:hypothetical protein
MRVWLILAAKITDAVNGRKLTPVGQRREAEVVLEEEGQEQEQREHAGSGERHRSVGPAAGAIANDVEWQQRLDGADLDADEGERQDGARRDRDDRQPRRPGVSLGVREAKHEREQASGHREHSRDIDLRALGVAHVRDQAEGRDRCGGGNQKVHVQGPAPREGLRQHASEQSRPSDAPLRQSR